MKADDYPDVESFAIKITESWTEGDIFKDKIQTITDFGKLKDLDASFGDFQSRKFHSVDLGSIFLSVYRRKEKEKTFLKRYTDTRKTPQGDDGRINRSIVCTIQYREKEKDAKSN